MLHLPSGSNCFAAILLWLAVAGSQMAGPVFAQSGKVAIGIDGLYRIGRWTGVRVPAGTAEASIASVETRDGDGVEVRYVERPARPPVESDLSTPHELAASAGATGIDGAGGSEWKYLIPGSEAAPLIIRAHDGTITSTRFPTVGSPSRGPAMIPLEMPWLVVFGDAIGVDRIGANELLERDALVAVSQPDAPEDLPDSSLGYDGIDMIMMSGSGSQLLGRLSELQQQAIIDWITDGGRLLLTLGESTPELLDAAPWLLSLLPIQEPEVARMEPSTIETFTSSQTPLPPFAGVILPNDQGQVLIQGRTTRRQAAAIAAEYIVGFGRITVIAADLENEPFASWPERLDLITQLTGSILTFNQEPAGRRNRTTAYNDLAGQVRSSLDQFEVKRKYAFSVVALILMALIAVIGPLDYLFLNRLLDRPLLGWITFPIVAIGLSALLVFESRRAGAGQDLSARVNGDRQCNRIEIVDIDSTRGVGRAFTLNYLYSHPAVLADVQVTESESLNRMAQQTGRMLTVPFGYPGESFGGIQIAIEDSRLPVYEVAGQLESRSSGGQTLRSSLLGMPLASRSSKGIMTRSRFVPAMGPQPALPRRPGSELLRGELVNPLPVDLMNGLLIYQNWVYLLPTRFPAGGRISSIDTLRQKNFRWQLSRQQAVESVSETKPWDPSDLSSTERIAEMLMFHGAVGGTRYTTLQHGPLSFLDLSHVLKDDRCVLMGRIDDSATDFRTIIGDTTTEPPGDRLTFVRVVIPVGDP